MSNITDCSGLSMRRSMYHVKIEPQLCKGCLLCVYVCNTRGGAVLHRSDNETLLGGYTPERKGKCIGCRWCERFCPDFAIVIEEVKG